MKFKIAFLTLLVGMGIAVFAMYVTDFMEVGSIDWFVIVGWLVMTSVTVIFVWQEVIMHRKNKSLESPA